MHDDASMLHMQRVFEAPAKLQLTAITTECSTLQTEVCACILTLVMPPAPLLCTIQYEPNSTVLHRTVLAPTSS